jgi:hypothetical protein
MATKSCASTEEIMQINNDLYHAGLQLLIILLAQPAIYAVIGTTAARILAQDGFSEGVNGAIAWIILVGCAGTSAWVSNQFVSTDPFFILGVFSGAMTLLLSGALHGLRPYLVYLGWVESHIFNVIPVPPSGPTAAAQEEAAWRTARASVPRRASAGGDTDASLPSQPGQ